MPDYKNKFEIKQMYKTYKKSKNSMDTKTEIFEKNFFNLVNDSAILDKDKLNERADKIASFGWEYIQKHNLYDSYSPSDILYLTNYTLKKTLPKSNILLENIQYDAEEKSTIASYCSSLKKILFYPSFYKYKFHIEVAFSYIAHEIMHVLQDHNQATYQNDINQIISKNLKMFYRYVPYNKRINEVEAKVIENKTNKIISNLVFKEKCVLKPIFTTYHDNQLQR